MNNLISEENAIDVINLGIRFRIPTNPAKDTKEVVINQIKKKSSKRDLWALRGINFSVKEGHSIGIVGRNGAGKSTLLKAIARVLTPTEGRMVVRGRVFPLLELGAGFIDELTGHENIYLNGNLLGMDNAKVTSLYDEILDFAEISDFINVPVRLYSSGMVARLAFAIATAIQPKVLLADEILSVGDASFRAKCMNRMNHYLSNGTTIVFVSHSPEQVKEICEYGLWLEHGQQKMYGSAAEVAEAYAATA